MTPAMRGGRLVLAVAAIGCLVGIALAGAYLADRREPAPVQATVSTPGEPGRTLTPAEQRAARDCMPVARWLREHDGYPPPFLLVKSIGGDGAERIPFNVAYRLAREGRVWTHAACEEAGR